jgi:hypothetical protein
MTLLNKNYLNNLPVIYKNYYPVKIKQLIIHNKAKSEYMLLFCQDSEMGYNHNFGGKNKNVYNK